MAGIILRSPAETDNLGKLLARSIVTFDVPALLMRGSLGAGKTTLTRSIVANLPGFEGAEVSSPSFTICNHYPTRPPVAHSDLFRCKSDIPEDVLSALEDQETISIIEWAEFLPDWIKPANFLDISFNLDNDCRLLDFHAAGNNATRLLQKLITWND